jgi:hypothetical protein
MASAQDQPRTAPAKPTAQPQPEDEVRERLDEQDKRIDELASKVKEVKPGNDHGCGIDWLRCVKLRINDHFCPASLLLGESLSEGAPNGLSGLASAWIHA